MGYVRHSILPLSVPPIRIDCRCRRRLQRNATITHSIRRVAEARGAPFTMVNSARERFISTRGWIQVRSPQRPSVRGSRKEHGVIGMADNGANLPAARYGENSGVTPTDQTQEFYVAPAMMPAPAVPQPMRRAPVNYQPAEPGWWLGTDGLWYPPETQPGAHVSNIPAISSPQTGSQNIVVHVSAPPPGYPSYPTYVSGAPKSRVAAGLLQIFFGGFGIGRFYLGYGGIGAAQLLLTLFTFGIGAIWGFIDGIVILAGGVRTDARGVPLQ